MTEETLSSVAWNGQNLQQTQSSSSLKKKPFHRGRNNKGNPKNKTSQPAPVNTSVTSNKNHVVPMMIQDPRMKLAASHDNPKQEEELTTTLQQRLTAKATKRGTGRNTESFDPSSTWVRPALRIRVGSSQVKTYEQPLRHDDVVIVPELFGDEHNWDLYYQLLEEMKDRKDWTSWHEGAHLIVKHPDHSPTFQRVVQTLCEYFHIRPQSLGVRFNWYKDSSDWKPFHHDSAAFNPQRAQSQNITVGASFGACRELAFLLATDSSQQDATRVYFPQPNNGVFSFGRDVNIRWKHGINAVKDATRNGEDQGRISIIVWGLAQNVIEEEDSPALLGSDGRGPHATTANHSNQRNNEYKKNNRRRNHHNKLKANQTDSSNTDENNCGKQTFNKENTFKSSSSS